MAGIFAVSLDFELYWGVRDKRSIHDYENNLRGVGPAVRELLSIFLRYNIHATWAVVGFLFFENLDAFKNNIPAILPHYQNPSLSPYHYAHGSEFLEGTYHFAPELIAAIKKAPGQEIGTHTFSHYYCLEEGQDLRSFREDMRCAISVAKQNGITIKSLVFPRNQFNRDYLSVLTDFGIRCYRGNENGWLYDSGNKKCETKIKRGLRLVDTYLNISGHHTGDISELSKEMPFNIPSSRFLRPFSRKLALLDGLKFQRIAHGMSAAARHNKIFHLWWHPHNFGTNIERNIRFLKRVLSHYGDLNRKYGMKSLNMGEIAEHFRDLHGPI